MAITNPFSGNKQQAFRYGVQTSPTVGQGLAKLVSTGLQAYGEVKEIDKRNENLLKAETEEDDYLLYLDRKAKLEKLKAKNSYDTMSGYEQEQFLNNFELNNPVEYKTDKYRNHDTNFFSEDYRKVNIKKQKDVEYEINNVAIPMLAEQYNILGEEDINNLSNGFESSGVKGTKKVLLNNIAKNVNQDIISRQEEFISSDMDKEAILEKYKSISFIKDKSLTNTIHENIDIIDKKVKEKRYTRDLNTQINTIATNGTINYSKGFKALKVHKPDITEVEYAKDIENGIQAYVNSIAESDNPLDIARAVRMANSKYGVNISLYDNHIKNFKNVAMQNPRKALEMYKQIKLASNEGYTFGNTDTKSFIEFETALEATGVDLAKVKTEEEAVTLFDTARELLENKESGMYKRANHSDAKKILKGNNIGDLDSENPSDVNAFHRVLNKYKPYHSSELAIAMAKKELELTPLVEYKDGGILSDSKKIDTSGTILSTKESVGKFLELKKQDYPNLDIDGIGRSGDLFYLTDSKGLPLAGSKMTKSVINKYFKDRLTQEAEEYIIIQEKANEDKKLKKQTKELYQSVMNSLDTEETKKEGAFEYNQKETGLAGTIYLAKKLKDQADAIANILMGQSMYFQAMYTYENVKDAILEYFKSREPYTGKITKKAVLTQQDIEETKKITSIMSKDEMSRILKNATEEEFTEAITMSPSNIRERALEFASYRKTIESLVDNSTETGIYGNQVLVLTDNKTGAYQLRNSIDDVPDSLKNSIISIDDYRERYGDY